MQGVHSMFSAESYKDYPSKEPQNFAFKTDEEVLMQFTGFRDKNGVEIFEGDILTAEGWLLRGNPNYAPVVFENGSFTWHGFPLGYDEETMQVQNLHQWAIVSGNIYEHPDLLTKL